MLVIAMNTWMIYFAVLMCVRMQALEIFYNKMLKQNRNQILYEGWRTRLRLVSAKEIRHHKREQFR